MAQILILQEGHYLTRKRKPNGDVWETIEEWIPVFIVDWEQTQTQYAKATVVLKKPLQFTYDRFVSPAGTIKTITAWENWSNGGHTFGGVYLTVDVEKINA